MSRIMTGRRRRLLCASAATLAALPVPALAQTQTFQFNIEAQSLDGALRAFARTTRRPVLFDGKLVKGKTSPALRGAHSAESGLNILLSGSRLRATLGSRGAYVIKPQQLTAKDDGAALQTIGGGRASEPAAEPEANAEIVVTAQKRTERLIDVPSAVTAISGDTLNRRNLTRIEEIAARTPGLSFNQFAAGLQVTLRGLNASGQGATTAILVDDVPLTSASSYQQATTPNFDTYDLERIEVLRGPQGTLYGASALGGLVKYVTRAPDLGHFQGMGQIEINTVRGGQTGGSARAALNLPIVTDAVALRVSGLYERLPGYVDNGLRNDRNRNDGKRYGVRGSLLWQAGPDFSVKLGAIWQRNDVNALPLVELVGAVTTPGAPPANAASIAHDGDLQRNSHLTESVVQKAQLYSAVLNYDAGAATITSVTSLAKIGSNQILDNTYESAFPGVTFGDIVTGIYGQPISISGNNITSIRRFNQEIRLASAPGGPIDYLAGFFYADEKSRITQIFDVLTVAQPARILTAPFPGGSLTIPATYRELAGFGQLTWHVIPGIDVTAGGRYAHNRQKSQASKFFGFATQLTGDVVDDPSKASGGKATWSAAISWHPVERVNIYGRVASGYRPGGPNARSPETPAGFQSRYDPDTTVNYELGAKGELFDRRLTFDVSIFTIDWSHIQIPTTTTDPDTGVPFNFTANAGKARSRGIEYAFRLAPIERLSLSVSGAYTDAQLRTDTPSIHGERGDQLPYVPKFANTVSLDYRVPAGAGAGIFAGLDWSYVGPRYSGFIATTANTSHQRLPDYHSINLHGGVDFGDWQLDLYVTNAGNARGLYAYSSGGGANRTGTGVIQQPRTLGARVSAVF